MRRSELKGLIKGTRPKFYLPGASAVFLGAGMAWYWAGVFNIFYFLLTLIGLVLAMAGSHAFNEYFDLKVDMLVKKEDETPFSGGSRVLPRGEATPMSLFKVGLLCWVGAVIVGIYLTLTRGWPVLAIALAGVFSGVFYTAPPFKLGYRGIGEFLMAFNYGPLVVLGTYYVQATNLPLKFTLLPALIPGTLGVVSLSINEFPDRFVDAMCGKKTLVVKLGVDKAFILCCVFMAFTFILLFVLTFLKILPFPCLLMLLLLPIAIQGIWKLKENYNKEPKALLPAIKPIVLVRSSSNFLLATGYILGSWI